MKVWILGVLFLVGCSWWGNDISLNNHIPKQKIEQEQINSSINDDSGWVKSNYPSDCDWVDFERVVDGDTLIVQDGRQRVRVRMIGIDTPESKREGTPIQDHALDSTRELQALLSDDRTVCLIQDEIGDQYDKYDRRLSYVFDEQGVDLNAEMLRQGWAVAYLRFPFERKSSFADLEATAKESAVGRWE